MCLGIKNCRALIESRMFYHLGWLRLVRDLDLKIVYELWVFSLEWSRRDHWGFVVWDGCFYGAGTLLQRFLFQ